MSEINVKMDLIKLDVVIKDIHHMWSEVPSEYIFPKSILAESRAALRTNVKKSLALAQKAHKLFQQESTLATRYNLVSEKIPKAGETARHQNSVYLKSLAEGEYDRAEIALETIIKTVSGSDCVDPHIAAELVSTDDSGCVILFTNQGENSISVMGMNVTHGSEKVKTEPRNTFTISGKGSRKVIVSAPSPIHVTLQYMDKSETKSFDVEL